MRRRVGARMAGPGEGCRYAAGALVLVMVAVLAGGGMGGCAASAREARPLTAEVRAETFDHYWGELSRHYPFFGISGVDWREERERWRDAAVGAGSPSEFYGVLASMLSGLDDPHVMLQPARGREGEGSVGDGERVSSPYLGLAWVGRRAYVRRWPADAVVLGEVGEAGGALPEGYPEVVRVNGVRPQRNMAPLVLRGPELTTVDVEARWDDGTRRVVRLTRPPAEFGGGAKAGWSEPPVVVHPALMAGTVLEHRETLRREVAIKWDDGTMSWMEFDGGTPVPGPAAEESEAVTVAARVEGEGGGTAAAVRRVWGDWLTSVDLGEVGYLRVSTLDYEDAAGGISLEAMVEAFDAAVDGLIEKRGIILDLRYNGGGRPQSLAAMAGRFVNRRMELASPERRFAGIVPYRYATAIEPRRPVYGGEIVVLINAETGSAAEHWASLLERSRDGARRVRVVGERSTGAEALVEIVRGPDGSELRYGWLRFVDEDGEGIQGVGVVPHVEVPLTIGRVREVGFAAAVEEVEREQFLAACRLLGVDGEQVLGAVEAAGGAEGE